MGYWERIDGDLVLKQYGDWAVTTYGVEHRDGSYPIEGMRLWELDWLNHMENRIRVNIDDFTDALYAAQEYHSKLNPKNRPKDPFTLRPGTRFDVMKRDNFQCKLCGKSAKDGAVLEVDHKHPRSKGGRSTKANLWTLCWTCNQGKSAKDLPEGI